MVRGVEAFTFDKFLPDLATLLSNIYATTGRAIFSILCLVIAKWYQLINHRVVEMINNTDIIAHYSAAADRLNKLGLQHVYVSLCVDQLSHFFGLMLLFEIIFIFVGFINATTRFLIFSSETTFHWNFVFMEVVLFLYHLNNFAVLCYFSDHIFNQVPLFLISTIN